MGKVYGVINGPAPGAAAVPKVALVAATIKTLLQFACSASREAKIVEHYFEMDGSAAAVPVEYELIRLAATTPATVTAFAAADVAKITDPNSVAPLITLGVAASGYTGTVEGTLVTPVIIEKHLVPPTSGVYIQFPIGREPEVAASGFLRQRANAPANVNANCGLMWEE